jgi:hypothetical protein
MLRIVPYFCCYAECCVLIITLSVYMPIVILLIKNTMEKFIVPAPRKSNSTVLMVPRQTG